MKYQTIEIDLIGKLKEATIDNEKFSPDEVSWNDIITLETIALKMRSKKKAAQAVDNYKKERKKSKLPLVKDT